MFSTAENNQTAVTIHVLQGEREMSTHNKSLGQFNLTDISPAPRGTPQIDVKFDIDANGILHVSAKDKTTGKENKITIEASSGLSEEEVERMIKDAEANAEEDRKSRELIEARNQCEALIHSVKQNLDENGKKLTEDEKSSIESSLKSAEEGLVSEDKETIENNMKELGTAAQKLAEIAAKTSQENKENGNSGSNDQPGESAQSDQDIVDAEFEEVKEEDSEKNKKD